MAGTGTAGVGSFCTRAVATSLSLGCLLDFLKTDEGSRLSLSRLIDMSAQVCELSTITKPKSSDDQVDSEPHPLLCALWLHETDYSEVVATQFRLGWEGQKTQSNNSLNL